jgi:phage repressor protein C with HTH and peptisase S24 domain
MDPVRKLILERIAQMDGVSLKSLSLAIDRSHSYLQQFIHRGVPAELPEVERHKLAPLLNVAEADLRGPEALNIQSAPAVSPQGASAEPAARQNARMGGSVGAFGTIPVYGQAVAGRDGQFILNGNKIADILAPPALSGVPGAYAVYVVGDSMEDRYHAGEAVFVNPRLPVRRDDYVVVQIAGDEGEAPSAFVKRFIGRNAQVLKLLQLNPRKALEFPTHRVVSVHRIVMGGDG